MPILLGNKLIGILHVHSTEKNWFTESDKAILQALAGRVALGIIEHQQRSLSKLQEIVQRMTASIYFDEIAELIAEGIKDVVVLAAPEKISPLLYVCDTPESPRMLLKDQQNFGKKFKPKERKSPTETENGLLVPVRNDGLAWEAIKKLAEKPDEPSFIVRENVDDPVSGGSDIAQERGVITTVCTPLVFGGDVYGLLCIHINERHFFSGLEKEILTFFAAHAAVVLKNLGRRSKERTYSNVYENKLINEIINLK